MTYQEMANECAAVIRAVRRNTITGDDLIAGFNQRYPGEMWPIHWLWSSLFPEKLPPLQGDPGPWHVGDMRYDQERKRLVYWTGANWWSDEHPDGYPLNF